MKGMETALEVKIGRSHKMEKILKKIKANLSTVISSTINTYFTYMGTFTNNVVVYLRMIFSIHGDKI
ncbi:MAG TPA: hypothetical protein PK800_02670, partial [Syntrophorhabdaceae bacterium]|nr:hypothetical protein [Syntrophorhabdaceae bacterium]